MVEGIRQKADSKMNGASGSGWDDGDEEEEQYEEGWGEAQDENNDDSYYAGDTVTPVIDDKGFRFVKSLEVSRQVVARIEQLQDLYALDLDCLIIVARHYNWNIERMQDWFAEEERLKY